MTTCIINRERLSVALSSAARIAGKSAFPDVRLSADDDKLTIEATDMEHWLHLSLPCSRGLPAICVHAERLRDTIASMFGDEVSLNVDGGQLRLEGHRGRRQLATVPVNNWPQRDFKADASATVDGPKLREAFAFCLPNIAAPDDAAKRYLSGIHVFRDGGKLKAIGCDTFNLAVVELADCAEDMAGTISPLSAEIAMALATDPVDVCFNERASKIRWHSGWIIGPLVEGDYPSAAVMRLFKLDFTSSCSVEAKDLLKTLRSIRAVGAFDTMTRSRRVTLTLNGSAVLSTASHEGSCEQELTADWEGEGEYKIGFASARMERLLGCFGDAVLSIQFGTPTDPMRFDAAARPDRSALLYPQKL